ncbi:armadillo-domain containing rhoptry protein (ARO) [Plasmodium ovale wallikeri]|uniref:Armadillo-domain containing rhoptry protein (ARO) n=1 Tax=Plasmodium ovale wallikeri TaxID=864142 RepID=A0A1A8YNE6_PLAOA|nr:armadillo-domain containing rhoptry protein (ARO) [Plasmodium ovale wallikeri]SBT32917.1 armadillo-domain containing rhoptry protein (ARO) [Plasmodium ovale wallikeri]
MSVQTNHASSNEGKLYFLHNLIFYFGTRLLCKNPTGHAGYREGLQEEKLKENKVVTKLEANLTDMTKEKVKDNFCNMKSNDILRFDKAYDENDVQEFVNLCSSACEIEKLEDRMHPWAADPKTIGALSATQLAILASKENVKNCISMFDNGAMPYLISGMKSSIDGMKAACAQTCRNIFVLDKKYKKEFLKLGGITQLVKLLELPSNYNDSQPLYTQLEAIYHLEDFILNDGDEVPEFLEAVKNSNAIKNLKNLQQCPEQDLAEASNVLLLRLTD